MKLLKGNYYAVTVNPSVKRLLDGGVPYPVSKTSQLLFLKEILDNLNQVHQVTDINYELTPAGNYHVHFTLKVLNDTFQKSIYQGICGLSVREMFIRHMYNPSGWTEYCHKDVPTKFMF